jgi:hypothetical protein
MCSGLPIRQVNENSALATSSSPRTNSKMQAVPWQSGASAPRKAFRSNAGLSPCGRPFSRQMEFFRSLQAAIEKGRNGLDGDLKSAIQKGQHRLARDSRSAHFCRPAAPRLKASYHGLGFPRRCRYKIRHAAGWNFRLGTVRVFPWSELERARKPRVFPGIPRSADPSNPPPR